MAGILLNFVEAELDFNQISVFSTQMPQKSIKQYRDEYGNDYHFYFYQNQILFWQKNTQVKRRLSGDRFIVIRQKHPGIFSKIIECAVIDWFYKQTNHEGTKAYKIYKNQYYTWELTSIKNEIESQIPGLGVYRKMTLHPVYLNLGEKIVVGFTLAASLKFRFLWNATEFRKRGIDTNALTILEDETVVPNLQGVFHFLTATGKKEIYDAKISQLENNASTFGLIEKIVTWLNTKKREIILPDNLNVTSFSLRYLPFQNIHASQIFSPKRYFYNNAINLKKLSYYNEQVKEYKPFSYGQFEDKEIKIGVLYPSEYEGRTEIFFQNLKKSLLNEVHLKEIRYIPLKVKNTSLDAYKRGIYENHTTIKDLDIVLVIVNEEHEKLPPNLSPYYVCKAKLIGLSVPTQDVQIETIQNRVHPLVMNNITLNIYAKIGGTAWTIEREEKLKDELIIGVGSTKSPDGYNILGIAQVFHPDGRYILGDCSPLSTFDNYAQNLEEYLYSTLKEVIDSHIDTNRSFRLIFHLYKSAAEEYELKAIERLIKRFGKYQFDYALLHLGYGHNYRFYADNGDGKLKKGTYVKISSYIALLHFVPDSVLPLKIELDRRSKGFNDLFYLAKQIYWFSSLSHRSYNPSKRTVTIMYPSLMAALTEKLSQVEGWNYDMLEYVKHKQWFI